MFYIYVHVKNGVITKGRISIHPADRMVLWNGRPIKSLAPMELKLLQLLVLEAPKVLDNHTLAVKVWRTPFKNLNQRTIYEHVRRIRKKLGPAAICLKTVSRFGLQWLDKSMFPTDLKSEEPLLSAPKTDAEVVP